MTNPIAQQLFNQLDEMFTINESTAMTTEKALTIVVDIASRWGENVEEGFTTRMQPEMSDDECKAIADASGEELDDVTTVRDLWRAVAFCNDMLKQQGCEHFDPAVKDGKLTTLCDVVVVG